MPIAVMDRKLEQAIRSGDLAKVKKCYNVKCKAAEHIISCSNPDIFRFLIKKGFPMVNAGLWYDYAYKHSDLKLLKVTFKHIEPRTLEFAPERDVPIKIKEFPTLIITKENGHLVKHELHHNTIHLEDPLARAIVLDRTDIVEFLLEPGSRGGVLKKYSKDCADTYIKLAMCYTNPKTILALSPDILRQAAIYGRMDVFEYGKDKFKPDSQCMEIALINEDLKLVKYLYKFIPFDLKHLALEKLHAFVMPKADYDTVTSYYIEKKNVEFVKSRKRYTFNHINIAIDANSIEIVLHIIKCINRGNFTREHEKRAIEKHSNAIAEHFIKDILPEHVDVAIESANIWFLEKCMYRCTVDHLSAALKKGDCMVFRCIINYVSVNENMRLKMFKEYMNDDKALNVLCQTYPVPEDAIKYAIENRFEDALKKLIFNATLKLEYFNGSEAVENELCRQITQAYTCKQWTKMKNLLELSKCAKVLALTKKLTPDMHCYYYFVHVPKPKPRARSTDVLSEPKYVQPNVRPQIPQWPVPPSRERTMYAQIQHTQSADKLL